MKASYIIATAGVLAILFTTGLGAQDAKTLDRALQIRQFMTPSEFKSCGLEKLSPDELARLDAWLQLYTCQLVEGFASRQTSLSTPYRIDSRITGTFKGWDGETIFKLENGQVWQQSSYGYVSCYSYCPCVSIQRTNGRYRMKVEGVRETVYVERLK